MLYEVITAEQVRGGPEPVPAGCGGPPPPRERAPRGRSRASRGSRGIRSALRPRGAGRGSHGSRQALPGQDQTAHDRDAPRQDLV